MWTVDKWAPTQGLTVREHIRERGGLMIVSTLQGDFKGRGVRDMAVVQKLGTPCHHGEH